jgi:hypothetical protein
MTPTWCRRTGRRRVSVVAERAGGRQVLVRIVDASYALVNADRISLFMVSEQQEGTCGAQCRRNGLARRLTHCAPLQSSASSRAIRR